MKKILKRVNRGLVLAVALIVGLIGYLTVDAATFSEQADDVRTMLSEFAKLSADLNILPEQYQKTDVSISAKDRENMVRDMQSKTGSFLSTAPGNEISWNESTLCNMMDSRFAQVENDKMTQQGVVYKMTITLPETIKVTRAGSNLGRIARLKVTIVTEYVGQPQLYLFATTTEPASNWGAVTYSDKEGYITEHEMPTVDLKTIKRTTRTVTYDNILVSKENGKWRVYSGFNGWSWGSGDEQTETIGEVK